LLACALNANASLSHVRKIDDNVYSGRQPSRQEFAELKQMGIRTVLDLRGGMIHSPHERKLVQAEGMNYVSIRLSGFWEPRDRQIARILSILQDPAQSPVFIHCRRGDDRTGLVVACYRIAHDHWSNQKAIEEAKTGHLNILEVLMRRYINHFDAQKVQALAACDAGHATGCSAQ
jgi:tyrosine-protein phosphatase SIW14